MKIIRQVILKTWAYLMHVQQHEADLLRVDTSPEGFDEWYKKTKHVDELIDNFMRFNLQIYTK